jgi:hypothetical protein
MTSKCRLAIGFELPAVPQAIASETPSPVPGSASDLRKPLCANSPDTGRLIKTNPDQVFLYINFAEDGAIF